MNGPLGPLSDLLGGKGLSGLVPPGLPKPGDLGIPGLPGLPGPGPSAVQDMSGVQDLLGPAARQISSGLQPPQFGAPAPIAGHTGNWTGDNRVGALPDWGNGPSGGPSATDGPIQGPHWGDGHGGLPGQGPDAGRFSPGSSDGYGHATGRGGGPSEGRGTGWGNDPGRGGNGPPEGHGNGGGGPAGRGGNGPPEWGTPPSTPPGWDVPTRPPSGTFAPDGGMPPGPNGSGMEPPAASRGGLVETVVDGLSGTLAGRTVNPGAPGLTQVPPGTGTEGYRPFGQDPFGAAPRAAMSATSATVLGAAGRTIDGAANLLAAGPRVGDPAAVAGRGGEETVPGMPASFARNANVRAGAPMMEPAPGASGRTLPGNAQAAPPEWVDAVVARAGTGRTALAQTLDPRDPGRLPAGDKPLARELAPGQRAATVDGEIIEWRAGGALQPAAVHTDGRQDAIDPRLAWRGRNDSAQLMKLSLTVIPPVVREGEMTQSATRSALFRAVVNGQQAFVDVQGRVVGWAVRQDLPATYVTNVVQTEQLMQLPDGRQVIVDPRGRILGLAHDELLDPVKASEAADPRQLAARADARLLAEEAHRRLLSIMWSTVLPSGLGLLLVIAAFLSAAAVGAMPWLVHAVFMLAALGLGVYCARTWKRCNRLPDGTVTRLPAMTRRIRVLMALSCSAQGAGAILLGAASVLF